MIFETLFISLFMTYNKHYSKLGNWFFKHRGTLPVVVLIVGIIVKYFEVANYGVPGFWKSGIIWSLSLACLGVGIRACTVGQTPKGTSGRNTDQQLAEQLNTTGIYSMVRNPLYLGNFFVWLSIALLASNWIFTLVFILLFTGFYQSIIKTEEAFLTKKYNEKYEEWRSQTPMFLPSWRNYKAYQHPFNWRKVIRKEKNGVAAIGLCFWLFTLPELFVLDQMNPENHFRSHFVWYAVAFLSGCYYLTIKLLIKYSHFLDNKSTK